MGIIIVITWALNFILKTMKNTLPSPFCILIYACLIWQPDISSIAHPSIDNESSVETLRAKANSLIALWVLLLFHHCYDFPAYLLQNKEVQAIKASKGNDTYNLKFLKIT